MEIKIPADVINNRPQLINNGMAKVMSLYISIRTASSELTESPINKAITSLATTIAMKMKHNIIPDGPSIDVTFMLPGKHDKPDFTGMRMGGYSQENNTLFFEKAVPEHIIYSDEADKFVELVMQDVVENANDFFRENNISYEVERWQHLLSVLKEDNQNLSLRSYS